MNDREARERLAAAARAYLNEEVRNPEFLDNLCDIAGRSDDHTISTVAQEFEDWCEDDTPLIDKAVWDYMYRLILVLESGAEIAEEVERRRSPRQLVAICTLVLFGTLAFAIGRGGLLPVLWLIFGAIAVLLSLWEGLTALKTDPLEPALTPFSSVRQILAARRRACHFSKIRYSRRLTGRRIWARIWHTFDTVSAIGMILILPVVFAPVVLLLQCAPKTYSRLRVNMPQH